MEYAFSIVMRYLVKQGFELLRPGLVGLNPNAFPKIHTLDGGILLRTGFKTDIQPLGFSQVYHSTEEILIGLAG